MVSFVNRETELKLIDNAFNELLNKDKLLHTPIIGLYGVDGIGKTSLLEQVQQKCHETHLPYIWINVSQSATDFSQKIISQVEKYRQGLPSSEQYDGILNQSAVRATQTLLKHTPVVLLLDEVDTANAELLNSIRALLRDLLENEKLFVVLASKRLVPFLEERTIARKLTPLQLPLLDKNSCEQFLGSEIEPEIRETIFEWTRGYPAAMNVMVQEVQKGLSPQKETDRETILSELMTRVIDQGLLKNVAGENVNRYRAVLQLLALPRRFNLVIMQDVIERFTPEFRRESSFAYFSLPREINEATDILNWSVSRSGFAVDTPVRNLLLLMMKLREPERYFAIHEFLAKVNQDLATEVTGFDRIRYLREALYHTACGTAANNQLERLQTMLQLIEHEPAESYFQFWEEFSQDDELQEALDGYLPSVLFMIHQHLAHIYKQLAENSSGPDKLRFLNAQFFHLINASFLVGQATLLKNNLQTVIDNEKPTVVFELFEELKSDERLQRLLGDDFGWYGERIRKNLSLEG